MTRAQTTSGGRRGTIGAAQDKELIRDPGSGENHLAASGAPGKGLWRRLAWSRMRTALDA